MKHMYCLFIILLLSAAELPAQNPFSGLQDQMYSSQASLEENHTASASGSSRGLPWPWTLQRMDYFSWWSTKVGVRMLESFEARPAVRYLHQNSELVYVADETIFGGEIVIDDDLLNSVNLPSILETRLRALRIELPMGTLYKTTSNWTSMAHVNIRALGLSFRGSYWSGALSPGQFPQPGDFGALFDTNKFIGLAAREIASTSALNNAISLEFSVHPLQILSGFRQLEWASESGLYLRGDFSFGWIKSTDLTFKQGRELLGEIDLAQEIRDILPDALEALINTNEAGDILLTAIESRLPLYGFGLPVASGRTMEFESWVGYQWTNKTWSGDARIGFFYQSQELTNQHPSTPVLRIRRWTPTFFVKWVFNKKETGSSMFTY